MTKIVFIGGGLSSGGAEHQCAQLMDMLIEKGYDVTYVSIGDVEDHYQVSDKIKRINLKKGRNVFSKIISLQLFLLKTDADVVIAFSQRMSVISIPALLLRRDIKLISGERNYTRGREDIFEKILIRLRFYSRSNIIVPNNHSQGDYLIQRKPQLDKKIKVIINYTNTNEYCPSAYPNNYVPRIGIFCRLEKQKNVLRTIEAFNIIKNKYGIKFSVDWFGNHEFSNPKQIEYYNEAKNRISTYGLSSIINIKNATKNVNQHLKNYDCLCLPSLHEGFSNSIAEYISSGRPVLCSDVSDNHIMVHDGVNGYLFDPTTPSSIAEAFVKFFNLSLDEKKRMGDESRKIAVSLFDREKFISDYINIIENES